MSAAIGVWLILFAVMLFAVAESALARSSATRLEELAKRKGRLPILTRYQAQFELFQFSARVLKVVLGGIFIFLLYYVLFADRPGLARFLGALALAGVALWLTSEVVSQLIASSAAEKIALAILPLLAVIGFPFRWLFRLQEALHKAGGRLGGREEAETPEESLAEELLDVVTEGEREGALKEEEREMIESIIEFRDVRAAEIMTPRTEMVTVPAERSVQQAQEMARQRRYSRLPVVSGSRDNIVGILYVKDLIYKLGTPEAAKLEVRDLMRKPYFIPETKRVEELLREFRTRKLHIAIVLDEYGGTAGLVTIEDIIEEIVGEIEDEYEPPRAKAPLEVIDEHAAELSARVHIDELNQALGISLPEDEDYETVGGFIFAYLGRIPREGESFTYQDLELTILEADERQVRRLRVTRLTKKES